MKLWHGGCAKKIIAVHLLSLMLHMHVRAAGIDAEDVFAYDASYGSAFVGSLGVKQESDSWEWGLSYRYSANSNQHSNDIMANIAFKF